MNDNIVKRYASEDYVTEAIAGITVSVDNTLSVSGKAADAGAVGTALANIYTKAEIDMIMQAYINDIDALLGGDA